MDDNDDDEGDDDDADDDADDDEFFCLSTRTANKSGR